MLRMPDRKIHSMQRPDNSLMLRLRRLLAERPRPRRHSVKGLRRSSPLATTCESRDRRLRTPKLERLSRRRLWRLQIHTNSRCKRERALIFFLVRQMGLTWSNMPCPESVESLPKSTSQSASPKGVARPSRNQEYFSAQRTASSKLLPMWSATLMLTCKYHFKYHLVGWTPLSRYLLAAKTASSRNKASKPSPT